MLFRGGGGGRWVTAVQSLRSTWARYVQGAAGRRVERVRLWRKKGLKGGAVRTWAIARVCGGLSIGGFVWTDLRGRCVWAKAKMRRVFVFLACLLKFWTWKDLLLGWVKTLSFHSANVETMSAGQLALVKGQEESEFARFLSSLPEDDRWCSRVALTKGGVCMDFGPSGKEFGYGGGFGGDMGAGYSKFLASVASSKTVYHSKVYISFDMNDGGEHLVGLVDALRQSGNDFRKAYFFCISSSTVKCATSVLQMCDGIKDLSLEFLNLQAEVMGKEVVAEFMANVTTSNNLQILRTFSMNVTGLDGEGMEEVMKPFMGPNNILKDLTLHGITLDVGLEHVSAMLATSTTLKSRNLNDYNYGDKNLTRGYTSIASALCNNKSLKMLKCGGLGSKELKALMDPLLPQDDKGKHNNTLTELHLAWKIGGQEGVESLVEMLQKNTSLLHLSLFDTNELNSRDPHAMENVLAILEALKGNKSLKTIRFRFCDGVGGSKVLGSMMDLLLENHCIEDIGLVGTPLDACGDAKYVRSALSKRRKMELWDVVRGMANVRPTSGRIFLCGEPYAGKTQLRISMTKLPELQLERKGGKWGRGWKQNLLKRGPKSKMIKEDVVLKRTRGIEVASIPCDGMGITIWDMAGQIDYHSFHELVMPNLSADGSCTLFMLLCNPMQQSFVSSKRKPSKIKAEIESWLRMIASNTRRSLLYRPHVCIVMTHLDYWKDDDDFGKRIVDVVEELRSQFEEVLEFDDDKVIFKVDGRTELDARGVFDFMRCHLKGLLARLPSTIGACVEVQRRIAKWNLERPKEALLKWDEFCKHMCEGVKELEDGDADLVKSKREFVAISLNDGGHIIYNEEGATVITNPQWFCHDIMGEFLHECANKGRELEMVSSNGMISLEHMKRLISGLIEEQGDLGKSINDILEVMKKLHVCYEQDAKCIMIPSMLEDKHHSLQWSKCSEVSRFVYVGRRVACKDGRKTMLSGGFFARLQVSLFKNLQCANDRDTYKLYRDVIQFMSNGYQVIVEFNDGDIDILLRSDRSQDEMLAFIDHQIVRHIKHLQEDPVLGCLGVLLEEHILRPACVENLTSSEHRKKQFVCTKDLEVEVARGGFEAVHNWKSCEGLDSDSNKVKALLGGLAWTNLLKRRATNLEKYEKEIMSLSAVIPSDMKYSDMKHDASSVSILGRFHMFAFGPIFVKFDELSSKGDEQHNEVISKLDDLKEMVKSLEKSIMSMEGNLLREVCAKIDKLMVISKEVQASQIPKLAYLCEASERKLLTRLVPGLVHFHLHLMCENMGAFHEVANQRGCAVTFGTEESKRAIAMWKWGLKIATMLVKVGAHVACGMGEMVPNWSSGSHLVALVLDTPGILDGGVSISNVELLPNGVKEFPRITMDEGSEAQRWMMDFLEPKCKSRREFHEMFELTKVRYKCEGGLIAWICDGCKEKQSQGIELL